MCDETYNGWSNRETWAVALHINNDQGWQESVFEALREAQALSVDEVSPSAAGEIIRDSVESVLDVLDNDSFRAVQGDIGSLWRVDWRELGAAFLNDLAEQD